MEELRIDEELMKNTDVQWRVIFKMTIMRVVDWIVERCEPDEVFSKDTLIKWYKTNIIE